MTDPVTIKIEAIPGEFGRYRVESKTNPDAPHMVDLFEHSGNGECSCPDFKFRKYPNLKSGKPSQTHHTECRHIMMAASKFQKDARKFLSNERLKNKVKL